MSTAPAPEKLLTPDDLAVLLGVSRLLVIRQSRTGKIPAIKLGKVYRYRSATIQSWLKSCEALQQEGARDPQYPLYNSVKVD
jgi:excisionase family DNA binding protein